ncbi:MAG TPA: PLP-dependent aminotransferase family protein [Acidimicrobiales bacterium]|nr:PLP-dependent aminotransferase family protein [Acidimicrobiales bacterium]
MAGLESLWSERARTAPDKYFPVPPVPVRYNFGQGVPAPELYPVADLQAYAVKVLEQAGAEALSYVSPDGPFELVYGYTGFRRELARWISQRQGKAVTEANIMLCNGSSQGLALAAEALVGPGDGVVVEAATFPFAANYLRATGATVVTAPLDQDGMDVDALEKRLHELREAGIRPKLVYTIPTFQVPTATCMPLRRRHQLLELANEWDLCIVEDNCYYEVRYDGADVPTLFGLDDSGRVVQSDSFSKTLAPALRAGWIVADPALVEAMARVRQDLQVSQWMARILEAYLRDGKLQPQIDRVRAGNRRKRDVTHAALQRYCSRWVRYDKPAGGLYFWLELSTDVDWEKVGPAAQERGIACRAGETYTGDESGRRFLRIAYLHETEEQIEWGIRALGDVLAGCAKV